MHQSGIFVTKNYRLYFCVHKKSNYKSGFGEFGKFSSVTNTYLTVSTHIDPKQNAKAT